VSKPILVSNSLLRRRKELDSAIWTWLWLVDQTTQITPYGGGLFEGLVSDGDKVKVEMIAEDLCLPPEVVRGHIKVLQKAGLVRKMGYGVSAGLASVAGAR
jgi:hypothetical protein